MADLGYYKGAVTGKCDGATRLAIAQFQSDEGLIASGGADYDLLRRLNEKQVIVDRVKAQLRAQRATSVVVPSAVPSAEPGAVPKKVNKIAAAVPKQSVMQIENAEQIAEVEQVDAAPTAAVVSTPSVVATPLCPAGSVLSPNGCVTDTSVLAGYLK